MDMSIRPVDLNGMIQRTNDVSVMKQHEDSKPVIDQQNIQQQVHKQEENAQHQVHQADDAALRQQKFDAKEEGKGFYQKPQGKKDKKKQEEQEDGKVIAKTGYTSFDIKI